MLIITRRISEKVIIEDDIEIMILGIKGCQVRLGITAPKEVSVNREEIWVKIQEEKKQEQEAADLKGSAVAEDKA